MPLTEFKPVNAAQLAEMPHKNLIAHAQALQDRIEELEIVIGLLPTHALQFKFCHFTPTEERYLGLIYKQQYVCTKEMIYRAVYGGIPESDQPQNLKIIDVVVCKIRHKLKHFNISIHTMWGRGYYFDETNREGLRQLIQKTPVGCVASPESPMMLRANATA